MATGEWSSTRYNMTSMKLESEDYDVVVIGTGLAESITAA